MSASLKVMRPGLFVQIATEPMSDGGVVATL